MRIFAIFALSFLLAACVSGEERKTSFSVVVLGSQGGLVEGDLSSYLVTRPGSGVYVALDAGSLISGLRVAHSAGSLDDCRAPAGSDESPEGWVLREGIKAYLISHAHLDHVAGLVIASTDDKAKPLLALDSTIDRLKEQLFNWEIWPNFGDEGRRPLNKYSYQRLKVGEERRIDNTSFAVEAFALSHSKHTSTAFLLRSEDEYLLYCGDTGPDEVEESEDLKRLWQRVAPLVREGSLKALMLEVSFPDGRKPEELYGHLSPHWMMKELRNLALEVDASQPQSALGGLNVVVTHIKPSLKRGPSPRETIKAQLTEQNDLGVRWIFPLQGQRLEF